MEVLARDLRALGLYTARSLSYDGVEYEMLEHALTPEQRGISGGQKKRVNIGVELVSYPRVLFLDEPSTGMDPVAMLQLWNVIWTWCAVSGNQRHQYPASSTQHSTLNSQHSTRA